MKASFGLSMLAYSAALAAAPALAQTAPAPEAQQGQTVGPRELRDFSLPGTTPPPAQAQPEPQPETPPARTDTPAPERPAQRAVRQAVRPAPEPAATAQIPETQPPADAPQDLQSQPQDSALEAGSDDTLFSQPSNKPVTLPPAAEEPIPQSRWGMVPWFAAALLGALAAGYALLRRRRRAALEGIRELETFVPVEPVPPAPPLPRASPPQPPLARSAVDANKPSTSGGVVSTRLRPVLELELVPARCVIDQQQAAIEFTIVAMNSGNAPARDVRIEVAMINAGPAQDQEIARFFEQPAGIGEPLEIIPPMRSIQLNSRVSMPMEQVRAFEAAGRKLFVPLLAFNALFRWSSGEGQTSASYLVGREGEGEKMAPFRLDLGPRIFRGLGARPHHMQVRR
jgi:hypothetical protein